MRRLVLICACLVASLAHAETPDEQAQNILNHGVQLLDSGHVEEARAEFARVVALVPDKANPYRLLGVADFRLGRCKEAVAELEAFLSRVGANDRRVTDAVSMRDKCKEELKPKVGGVTIDSSPRGAEVRLDDENGRPVGVTPWHDDALQAGAHVAFLRKPGFQPASRGFTLQKGEKLRIELTLPREEAVATEKPRGKPVYKKGWFWGVMTVSAVVVGGAVAVGVIFGTRDSFSPTLPAYHLGLGAP